MLNQSKVSIFLILEEFFCGESVIAELVSATKHLLIAYLPINALTMKKITRLKKMSKTRLDI